MDGGGAMAGICHEAAGFGPRDHATVPAHGWTGADEIKQWNMSRGSLNNWAGALSIDLETIPRLLFLQGCAMAGGDKGIAGAKK
jgi:hypothetical protein